MSEPISRRSFIALTSAALILPPIASGKDEVPILLDHILLGCRDLQSGIEFVEQKTGVKAAFGGVHPGRGTQNALLSLGERHYLEIIAPDPAQSGATDPMAVSLRKLEHPKLVEWAAHPGDISSFAQKLKEAGVSIEGPRAGSRKRPDGKVLNWTTLGLSEDFNGLLPFFIEWGAQTVHPSLDAPAGCKIVRFQIVTPETEKLQKMSDLLGLNVEIVTGDMPGLRATIVGPKGEAVLAG